MLMGDSLYCERSSSALCNEVEVLSDLLTYPTGNFRTAYVINAEIALSLQLLARGWTAWGSEFESS
jgi:hypothetical protein